jgi:hypothetical protein
VRLALANWQEASAGRLRFEESEAFEPATLRVFFAGYYPDFGTAKPQVDPESGEIHRADVIVVSDPLGDRLQRDLVVYLTALHELGHALGLSHSEVRGEIMYGFHGPEDAEWTFENYRGKLGSLEDIGSARASGITEADRRALTALYAADRPSSRQHHGPSWASDREEPDPFEEQLHFPDLAQRPAFGPVHRKDAVVAMNP